MREEGFLAGLEVGRQHGKDLPYVEGYPEVVATVSVAWARYWFRVWRQTPIYHPRKWWRAYTAYRRWFRSVILDEPLILDLSK